MAAELTQSPHYETGRTAVLLLPPTRYLKKLSSFPTYQKT